MNTHLEFPWGLVSVQQVSSYSGFFYPLLALSLPPNDSINCGTDRDGFIPAYEFPEGRALLNVFFHIKMIVCSYAWSFPITPPP